MSKKVSRNVKIDKILGAFVCEVMYLLLIFLKISRNCGKGIQVIQERPCILCAYNLKIDTESDRNSGRVNEDDFCAPNWVKGFLFRI